MKIINILFGSMLLLGSACASQPTLEEKLAGKTPDQQKEILLQECKEEAPGGRVTPANAYKSHVERMSELCTKMYQEMLPK